MSSTTGKPIECKAIVAWSPNAPLTVETISVDPPKAGEVRIKILSTSVCHTDLYTLSGSDPEANWPCILGHEGAGIVESVGDGVTLVQPGDRVVPLYIPRCNDCKFCRNPRTNLCSKIRVTQGQGLMPDGTSRFSFKGQMIYHYMGTSTFSEYSVVPDIAVAKIPDDFDVNWACLLGCGVSTGYGAALNAARVEKSETVAVFGLGSVGLAAAMACKRVGCKRIIGVDIDDNKFEVAKKFGITEFVNPNSYDKPVQQILVEMTDGGCDKTIECVGNVNTMRAALESCHKGWGVSVIVGVAPSGHEISTRPFQLVTGRTWIGSAFGGWKSRDDFPKLIAAANERTLDVELFITHRFNGIESVSEVVEMLKMGKTLKSVITLAK